MLDINHCVLGESSDAIQLHSSEDHRNVSRTMAQQAIRTIDIYTHDLDNRVYDDAEFIEGIKHLVTGHSHAQVRILIQDSTRATKERHRLFNLGQQITSKIKFHAPARETASHHEAFMIVDSTGIIHRHQQDRYNGSANFNDPKQARELQTRFDRDWEHSKPDPHLRRLSI